MGIQVHEDRFGLVSVSLTPAGTALGPTQAAQTFTVPDLKTTDVILRVETPSTSAGLAVVSANVSAANTLQLVFQNLSTGPLTSATGTYRFLVFRSERSHTAVLDALGGL